MRIRIDGIEYDGEQLSEYAKSISLKIQEVNDQILEKENLVRVLSRSKNGYIEDLKKEIVSRKSGFVFDDD